MMKLRTEQETPEQLLKQQRYLSMIYSSSVRAYVQTKNIYLESDAWLKGFSAYNTENRLNALNTAMLIPYGRDEYTFLLKSVGIELVIENTLYADHLAAISVIDEAAQERIARLFCVLYAAIREADGNMTSNFVANNLIGLPPAEQFLQIVDHVKQCILTSRQARSVDAWYLTQNFLNGTLKKEVLAQAIFNVTQSSTRRASILTVSAVNEANRNTIKAIEESLALSESLFAPARRKTLSVQKSTEEIVAVTTILDGLDLTTHEPWVARALGLSLGLCILDVTKVAVVGGANKHQRGLSYDVWYTEIMTKLYAFLSVETIRNAPAIGLYYFNKENQADFVPSEALIGACAQALKQPVTDVIVYLDQFMFEGVVPVRSARAAHDALIASQLNLSPDFHRSNLTFSSGASRYLANIINVWQAFTSLIAFLQTPFHVIMAAERIAKERGKIMGLGSCISAPDLEIANLTQGIRLTLNEIKALKKNESCRHIMSDLISQGVLQLLTVGPSFSLKEREEAIKEQGVTIKSQRETINTRDATIAALMEELEQLKSTLSVMPSSATTSIYPSQGKVGATASAATSRFVGQLDPNRPEGSRLQFRLAGSSS